MENVKGILSSRVGGRRIFHDILADLASPSDRMGSNGERDLHYRIYSLSTDALFSPEMDVFDISPNDFVIQAEDYGIPQARHRVILLGVRSDITKTPEKLPKCGRPVTLWDAIGDLPKIRSRISGKDDSESLWIETVRECLEEMDMSVEMLGDSSFESYFRDISTRIVGLPVGANRLQGGLQEKKSNNTHFLQQLIDPSLEVWWSCSWL